MKESVMTVYCKVLIVDDEMLVRQGIRHLLDWESEGFQIVGEAANGKEALDMVHLFQPNIVLTDIVMPVMDGEELTRIVKGMYPEIEIVVLSSFGEFEYVRSTFQSGVADYMLKPKLDAVSMLAVLKKTAERIPAFQHSDWKSEKKQSVDYILDKLISGYSVDYDRNEISTKFPYTSFVLLSVVQDKSVSLTRNEEWLEAALKAIIQKRDKPVATRRLSHQDGYIRYLLNLDNSAQEDAVQIAQQLAEASEKGHVAIVVALSRVFEHIHELNDIYTNDMLKVLDHRFFLPDRRLLIVNELEKQAEKGEPFDMEAFTAELNHQEFDLAFGRLSAYAHSMNGRLDTDMFEFKSFLDHSLFNIIVTLKHFHYEASALDEGKYEYFRAIHEAEHIGEVILLLEKFLNEAVSCVSYNRTGSPGIQKILQYMDKHFSQPLTLTEVAKHFHFNPSYLSNYFTVHNKEGFNEYLNRIRIDKACTLLRENPNLSISEISNLVGYSDHSYFTKVFRKLMGISPSHYRKK
jgi:two-component system response regulator YesN